MWISELGPRLLPHESGWAFGSLTPSQRASTPWLPTPLTNGRSCNANKSHPETRQSLLASRRVTQDRRHEWDRDWRPTTHSHRPCSFPCPTSSQRDARHSKHQRAGTGQGEARIFSIPSRFHRNSIGPSATTPSTRIAGAECPRRERRDALPRPRPRLDRPLQ